MPMEEEPVVGAMYEDAEGRSFEILTLNEDDGTIEVQYDDGTVDQIDIDAWYEMELQPVKPVPPWKEPDTGVEEEDEEEEKPKSDDEDDDDFDDYDDNDEYDDQ